MTSIEIRPTAPQDLDALAAVLVEVHETDGYPVEGVLAPVTWLELPNPIGQWTALLDDEPVGHVALMKPQPGDAAPALLAERDGVPLSRIGLLARLFVAPSARGHSLAKQLVHVVEAEARSLDLHLTLDVMNKDHAAIALYQTLGWTTLGTFRHTHGAGQTTEARAFAAPPSGLGSVGH